MPDPQDKTDPQDKPAALDLEDSDFVEQLWKTYYGRLRSSVRQRVREIRRPVASESEVAQSALRTYLRRAQEGEFQELADDSELWRLLKTIAIRKTIDMQKRLRAQKRGGDRAVYNQADLAAHSAADQAGVDAAPGNAAPPSGSLEVSELFNSLLEGLPDDRHRDLILLKLQGASVAMIAEHLSTTTRTVQRMIKKIELDWQGDFLES